MSLYAPRLVVLPAQTPVWAHQQGAARSGLVVPAASAPVAHSMQVVCQSSFRQPSCRFQAPSSWSGPSQNVPAMKVAPAVASHTPSQFKMGCQAPESEPSTAASTPRIGSSPGLNSTVSSLPPTSEGGSRASSPGPSRSRAYSASSQLSSPQQDSHTAVTSVDALAILLGQELVSCLRTSGNASHAVIVALTALGDQAVRMGIDYRTLGHNWHHPTTRLQYRQAQHPSTTCFASRQRAEASRQRLQELVVSIVSGSAVAETALVNTFLAEIGISASSATCLVAASASFSGVSAALNAELLLPLRALNECQQCMYKTYAGEAVPVGAMTKAVQEVIAATLSKAGGFSEWRYRNPVGAEQLRGLSSAQLEVWKQPTSLAHAGGLRTHEDEEGELGLFWATKIGGPSHGFDFEGQCLLPLLANARNKVLLVSDPSWPGYPVGRAHLRLLWTSEVGSAPSPRLWLETIKSDFDTTVDHAAFVRAALVHAVQKSEAMQVPLSLDPALTSALGAASRERKNHSGVKAVKPASERLTLRPSNGVCEASDYLSSKHDWVQLQEEITEPISRVLYVPTSCQARLNQQVLGRV